MNPGVPTKVSVCDVRRLRTRANSVTERSLHGAGVASRTPLIG